jgi:hypothetical protein
VHNDTIYDKEIDRQSQEFTSTIEDIIKNNTFLREKKELEEKKAKFPNHKDF